MEIIRYINTLSPIVWSFMGFCNLFPKCFHSFQMDIQKGTSLRLELLRVVQAPINTGIYYLKVGCGFFVVGCSCRNIKGTPETLQLVRVVQAPMFS